MVGKCCEDIGVAYSPLELEISYRNFITGDTDKRKDEPSMRNGEANGHHWQDIYLIYPMLEYIKQNYTHPDGNVKTKYPVYHYRCRHHDTKTGKCSIQSIKPRMCMAFPEVACKYTDCACPGDKRKLKELDVSEVPGGGGKLINILKAKKKKK